MECQKIHGGSVMRGVCVCVCVKDELIFNFFFTFSKHDITTVALIFLFIMHSDSKQNLHCSHFHFYCSLFHFSQMVLQSNAKEVLCCFNKLHLISVYVFFLSERETPDCLQSHAYYSDTTRPDYCADHTSTKRKKTATVNARKIRVKSNISIITN